MILSLKQYKKENDKRYQTAQEMIDDMQKVLIYPSRNFVVVHDSEIATRNNTNNYAANCLRRK